MFLVFQGKKTDVQSEPIPACWGAVCAGADAPPSTLAPIPTATSQNKEEQTLRIALDCISSRAISKQYSTSVKRIQKKLLSVCPSDCLYLHMRVTLSWPTDKFLSKQLRPCRMHQVEALVEPIVIVLFTPHWVPWVCSCQSRLRASQSG